MNGYNGYQWKSTTPTRTNTFTTKPHSHQSSAGTPADFREPSPRLAALAARLMCVPGAHHIKERWHAQSQSMSEMSEAQSGQYGLGGSSGQKMVRLLFDRRSALLMQPSSESIG